MSGHPGFDEPGFAVPAAEVFADGVLPGVDEQAPLPELVDVDADGGPPVADPVDEPMVRVEHRRIRVLSNYWHAGWQHAVPATLLRESVAQQLGAVVDSLPSRWGLAVFDAWRPLALQQQLVDASAEIGAEPGFIAPVSDDPATPPPHLTGGTVDVGLTWDWVPLAPGCGFDDTTALAHAAHLEDRPGVDRELRRLLFWSMQAQGFVVFPGEWWHFEHGTRRWAYVTGNAPRYGPADVSPFAL